LDGDGRLEALVRPGQILDSTLTKVLQSELHFGNSTISDFNEDGWPDLFARGFTEALIVYALGRPFGFTDENLAEEIMAAAKSKQYIVSEFIKTLVSSEKFRRK